MAGAYYWEDELPSKDENTELYIAANLYLRYPFAYRHSLAIEKPNPKFEQSWNTLKLEVPTWPGFSDDRINGFGKRLAQISDRKYSHFEKFELNNNAAQQGDRPEPVSGHNQ